MLEIKPGELYRAQACVSSVLAAATSDSAPYVTPAVPQAAFLKKPWLPPWLGAMPLAASDSSTVS